MGDNEFLTNFKLYILYDCVECFAKCACVIWRDWRRRWSRSVPTVPPLPAEFHCAIAMRWLDALLLVLLHFLLLFIYSSLKERLKLDKDQEWNETEWWGTWYTNEREYVIVVIMCIFSLRSCFVFGEHTHARARLIAGTAERNDVLLACWVVLATLCWVIIQGDN